MKKEMIRPKRLQERVLKVAKEANAVAELLAETVVGLQDLSRSCIRLADEIEQEEKQ